MKKIKTTLILFVISLLLFSSNSFAATVETSSDVTNITKYIAIGIAVVVVILLLILGYKMDSKENEPDNFKTTKNKKKEKNNTVKEDPKYEADKVVYEPDNINTTDLSESIGYDENEESLFSTMNKESDEMIEENPLDSESTSNDTDLNELEDMLDDVNNDNEEYGEDFDTSIIDSIDEDEPSTPKKNIDETMVFDSLPKDKTIEDNIVDPEESEDKKEEIDPIIEELDSLEDEPLEENNSSKEDTNKTENVEEKKIHKKYTKSKKVSNSANDFLAQMEENLKKDKKGKNTKK